MYINFDFSGLFYLAIFGLICGVVLALGAVGGLIWFVVNHVQVI
jgi:hypothetical protein